MASKTLSTGTLSLRFMQNAHRAKQLQAVEAERAQIEDEAQWEVSQAVKDAWNIAGPSSALPSATMVEHESSYLPFLSEDAEEFRPRGRRKFDRKGNEVLHEAPTVIEPVPEPPVQERPAVKKLHSISSFGPGPVKKKGASAKQVIFDNSGVGVDLRTADSSAASTTEPRVVAPPPASPPTFMKPAGIDSPTKKNKATENAKRDHDEAEGSGEEEENKSRKRKKKKTSGEP